MTFNFGRTLNPASSSGKLIETGVSVSFEMAGELSVTDGRAQTSSGDSRSRVISHDPIKATIQWTATDDVRDVMLSAGAFHFCRVLQGPVPLSPTRSVRLSVCLSVGGGALRTIRA